MADEVLLEFSVLNIFADPHPKGIYPVLLKKISRRPINLRGSDFLAITEPEHQPSTDIWTGRILVWTELDPDAPAVNTRTFEELLLKDTDVNVPEEIGLNGRVFLYALREKDHKIFFESKNEFGKHLSPYRLVPPLEQLFLPTNSRGEMRVELNVQPEEDALDRILGIPRLNILEIHIRKPNGDDNDDEAAQVLREMQEQGLKQQEIKLTAASRKKGMKLNKRSIAQATVASETDFVRGRGKTADGAPLDLSTKEYPMTIETPVEAEGSTFAALLRIARNIVVRRRRDAGPN